MGQRTQGNILLNNAESVHVTDFTIFILPKYEDVMSPVKCFLLLCSVLDRRGLTHDELPGLTTPVVPGLTTDLGPQTTVRKKKHSTQTCFYNLQVTFLFKKSISYYCSLPRFYIGAVSTLCGVKTDTDSTPLNSPMWANAQNLDVNSGLTAFLKLIVQGCFSALHNVGPLNVPLNLHWPWNP